ncbi:hypothetical protein PHJA_001734500 [Phtheirospermum japonicum]|uniref:Uncharacterized protein n=1 Tax=Phtheirospermum japonicum TaxID=374723 RepID=A0A830CJE2_9LAMI|nr:hypothetical protein PHJA_001734500 [Phtheirospermum japonicum]
MVAEPWVLKMGNSQVSSNLKHALHHENPSKSSNKKHGHQNKQTLGILSFEVANVMSKIIHLHKSLSENEILKLKNEILKSEGIKALVSNDEKQLLELALEEKLDDLNRVASVVSRLGKKCTIPALLGFEHVYGDIISGVIDIKELAFLVKDMDSMVRKMERYVNSTASLYSEMEVMNELEIATKKFQQNRHEESRKAFEQKLTWQKQDVRHLKDVSLWNRTYDKVVELLARTVCTIYARIHVVFFGDANSSVTKSQVGFSGSFRRSGQKSGQLDVSGKVKKDASSKNSSKSSDFRHKGEILREGVEHRTLSLRPKMGFHRPEHFGLPCCNIPGGLFMECLSLNSHASKVDYDDDDDRVSYDGESSRVSGVLTAPGLSGLLVCPVGESRGILVNSPRLGPKSRLLGYAPPTSVGGSALALHYANIIIVLEKFLKYPHLVGDEARDDLYHMLPTSVRERLKVSLKSYTKDLAIYDAPLAHSWRERIDRTLRWLGPLAHNMMRWQSERNFEQQQIVKRTNVLLVETLYFADREKMEAVMCEVLVGLNYICRFEQQQNALLDCGSSFDLEECMEWQLQQVGDLFDS